MRKTIRRMVLSLVLVGLAASWVMAAPPPWAPAHGRRRKVVRTRVYAPAPFLYSGVTYVPLRDVTSLVGAALLWDSLKGRAAVTYNGRELGLMVGSPRVYVDDEVLVLSAAPIVVNQVVYVPADFCDRYLELPTRHRRGYVEIEGPRGWHSYRVASRPPGRVVRTSSVRVVTRRAPARRGYAERPRRVEPRSRVRDRHPDRAPREWRSEGRPRGEVRGGERGGGRGRGEARGRGHGEGGGRERGDRGGGRGRGHGRD